MKHRHEKNQSQKNKERDSSFSSSSSSWNRIQSREKERDTSVSSNRNRGYHPCHRKDAHQHHKQHQQTTLDMWNPKHEGDGGSDDDDDDDEMNSKSNIAPKQYTRQTNVKEEKSNGKRDPSVCLEESFQHTVDRLVEEFSDTLISLEDIRKNMDRILFQNKNYSVEFPKMYGMFEKRWKSNATHKLQTPYANTISKNIYKEVTLRIIKQFRSVVFRDHWIMAELCVRDPDIGFLEDIFSNTITQCIQKHHNNTQDIPYHNNTFSDNKEKNEEKEEDNNDSLEYTVVDEESNDYLYDRLQCRQFQCLQFRMLATLFCIESRRRCDENRCGQQRQKQKYANKNNNNSHYHHHHNGLNHNQFTEKLYKDIEYVGNGVRKECNGSDGGGDDDDDDDGSKSHFFDAQGCFCVRIYPDDTIDPYVYNASNQNYYSNTLEDTSYMLRFGSFAHWLIFRYYLYKYWRHCWDIPPSWQHEISEYALVHWWLSLYTSKGKWSLQSLGSFKRYCAKVLPS